MFLGKDLVVVFISEMISEIFSFYEFNYGFRV